MMDVVTTILAAAAGGVALWCAVVFFISRISGWAVLAKTFGEDIGPVRRDGAAPAEPGAETIPFATLYLAHGARYKGALTVTLSPRGIYLRPILIFRVGHTALRIPWSAVTRLKRETVGLWIRAATVEIDAAALGRSRAPSLSFAGDHLIEALHRHAPPRLRGEDPA